MSSAQEGSNAEGISNVFNNSYTVLLSGIAKRCFPSNHADMRVPYREITLSPTHHTDRTEENPPLPVYDTSGPYTDADVRIDLSRGLPGVRTEWIKQRDDTEILSGPSSAYARQRERDLLTYHLRFPSRFISLRARSAQNVSQMHYVRKGIVTPEMEFVALRESMLLDRSPNLMSPFVLFGAQTGKQHEFMFRLYKGLERDFLVG